MPDEPKQCSSCDDCPEAETCEIRLKRQHMEEMLHAEFGSSFPQYLVGLSHAIIAALLHGCKDPGWFAVGVEIGMVVARRDPDFADRLVRICGYGAQVAGSPSSGRTAELIEELVGILLEPKVRAGFGWPQEKETSDE